MLDINIKKNSNESIINIMAVMASSDGEISQEEILLLENVWEKNGLDQRVVKKYLLHTQNFEDDFTKLCRESIKLINDVNIRNKSIKLLMEMAAADLIIHEDELLLLELIASEWEMYVPSLKTKE